MDKILLLFTILSFKAFGQMKSENASSPETVAMQWYNPKPVLTAYHNYQNEDTLFEKRISAFTWIPNGQQMILNIMRLDKTKKTPPLLKKFRFNLQTESIELLPIDGGGLVFSPNGNSVAYIRQVNGKDQINLYNLVNKEDQTLTMDTLKMFAISWSPDGKNLVYNVQTGKGANAKVEICIYNMETKTKTQITKNSAFRCYTPVWNTKNDKILFSAEKGDRRDQIYITDKKGIGPTNLTNDTSTQNYSPIWLNKKTIMYIQEPGGIMTMKLDGTQKQRIEGINTTYYKYNIATKEIAYLDEEGNLLLFNWKSKNKKMLIAKNRLHQLFNDSYFN